MIERKDPLADPFAGSLVRQPRREASLPTSRATQPQQRARAHVHSSIATQSIPNATPTVVTFNTVDFDTVGLFGTNRFTIPSVGKVAGCWLLHGRGIYVKAAGGTVRELTIRKNGTTTVAYSATEPNILNTLDVWLLVNDPNNGDFYELLTNQDSQDSSGAINLTTAAEKTYYEIIHLW